MQISFCKTPTSFIKLFSFFALFESNQIVAQSYDISQTGIYNIEINDPVFFSLSGDNATQIPIGFDFTFFGITYSDCYVAGDGFISFGDYPGGSICCGQVLPDPDEPNNLIALAWTNVDFSSAHYEVFGSAPERRLIITLDLRNPCDETYYGQVKLFETTNIIEIHTQEWNQDQCQVWSATQGIENGTGVEAITVPGRNYNNTWHVDSGDEDFVSFTPTIPGQFYVLSQSGTYDIEIDDPTFFPLDGDNASQIPIGFDFEFFGETFTDCFVGGDGFISFGEYPGGSLCCGQELPNQNEPNNLIAVAWTNIDGCSAHYELFGSAPYRRLVITLDLSNPCIQTYYGQVKLFETTNVIEIHTQEWNQDQCQVWTATQGLENDDGSVAIAVPERNNNNTWHIDFGDEDFVSFTPVTGFNFPSPQVYVDHEATGFNNGTSWENAFNDLQDALAALDYFINVREIWIAAGDYFPTPSFDRDTSFVLRGNDILYGGFLGFETSKEERQDDPYLVRISGDIGIPADNTDNSYHVIKIDSTCTDCVIDGLTITFGQADSVLPPSSVGGGLFIQGKILLDQLVIENNTSLLEGAAIYNTGNNAITTIHECLFQLNTSGLQNDIWNTNGAELRFEDENAIHD